MTAEALSFDSIFIEAPYSTRWQHIMVALCTVTTVHTGLFSVSPSFYRVNTEYTCLKYEDAATNESETLNQIEGLESKCSGSCQKWSFDYGESGLTSSVQESFELVCGKEIYIKLHGSAYFLGLILGSAIGGFVIDRIGRAKVLRMCYLLSSVAGIVMALTGSLILHLIAWTLISLFNMTVWLCVHAITMEYGKMKSHNISTAALCLCFGIGIMLGGPLSLLLSNWRHLILAMSAACFLDFLLALGLDESPRWFWTGHRYEEAVSIMQKAAKLANFKFAPDVQDSLDKLVTEGVKRENLFKTFISDIKRLFTCQKQQSGARGKHYTIIDVFRYRRLTFRLLILCVHWICVNSLYYGLLYGANLFKQGAHIYSIVQGCASMVGSGLLLVSVNRGRKRLAMTTLIVAGSCYFISIPIPPSNFTLILVFSAKISLQVFFTSLYLWSGEMMPTVVRSSAMGFASVTARLTGLVLPFVDTLSSIWIDLPLVFYGCLACLVACCSLLLPETRGQALPNSMKEGNLFGLACPELNDDKPMKSLEIENNCDV